MKAVLHFFQSVNEEILARISDNRDRISAAVAEGLDRRGWLPDEIIVVMLDSTEQIGRSLLSRLQIAGEGDLVISPLHLTRVEDPDPDSLARMPEHGCVRVLTHNDSSPVVAHAQYVTASNYEQWQSRLDTHIDRALTHMALRSKPSGLPS